jgi:hypothetical protein
MRLAKLFARIFAKKFKADLDIARDFAAAQTAIWTNRRRIQPIFVKKTLKEFTCFEFFKKEKIICSQYKNKLASGF